MTNVNRRIATVTTGQLGIVTRAQAHESGMSDHQLRRRVQSGILESVGPNAFRSTMIPRGPLADLTALILDVGPPCWVAGPTAAALHGFDGFALRRPFHLVLPRERNVRRHGATIHTTVDLPLIDRGHAQGLDVLSGARTVIDLARHGDADALTRAVDSGLRDGRFNEDLLHRRIAALRTKGRHGLPRLLDVLAGVDVTRGGHSWLERRFLALLDAAGLPRPATQVVLAKAGDKLVRVDLRFPGTPVVVELLGYRFHATATQLARDTARLNALVLAGHVVLQFTYVQIVEHPDDAIDLVTDALRAFSGSV